MFEEDDLLPISALQHLIFCDRQTALIHIERVWADNSFTVEGHHLHRTVDSMQASVRDGILTRRGISLRSLRLGLIGKADVVEFHLVDPGSVGTKLEGEEGLWNPIPIEYKRGKPKEHHADEVQLCAQALCLEEQFEVAIPSGKLFYGTTRRRQEVAFSEELRRLTSETATRLHDLIRSGMTPIRFREKKCDSCSLLDLCLPQRRTKVASARTYLKDSIGGLPVSSEAP